MLFSRKILDRYQTLEFISRVQGMVSEVPNDCKNNKLFAFELYNLLKFYVKNSSLSSRTLEKVLDMQVKEIESEFSIRNKMLVDSGYEKKAAEGDELGFGVFKKEFVGRIRTEFSACLMQKDGKRLSR